jgi:serine/arginine repetitive matrix protein 2
MSWIERNPNASGRTSRASDMSTISRTPSMPPAALLKTDRISAVASMPSSAPGIQSMLSTSIETGDLNDLVVGNRGLQRRGGTTDSRHSANSSYSNNSNRPRHQARPSSASMGTRGSRENNMPPYVTDSLSPTVMNVGSSNLIPRARLRDGNRSHSLTMAYTSEQRMLSSMQQHKSLSSIRSDDPRRGYSMPRPGSREPPQSYPNASGHSMSGSRSKSQAYSDSLGLPPQNQYGYGPSGANRHPQQPGRPRGGTPSDSFLPRHDGRYASGGHPGRAYHGVMSPDVPPLPSLIPGRRAEFEHNSMPHRSQRSQKSFRSAKTSHSSGSYQLRNDSDPTSSDATSPPTPQGNSSMGRYVGRASIHNTHRAAEVKPEPAYYDGSEEWEDANPVLNGFVAPLIKTTVSVAKQNIQGSTGALGIAELPASPVPRRITREIVKLGLGSPTKSIETPGTSTERKNVHHQAIGSEQESTSTVATAQNGSVSLHTGDVGGQRHSIVSQTGSSVMESSTLEFAVRSSIPLLADHGITMDTGDRTGALSAQDAEPNSEDGMSDLLDGYQHTDTKPQSDDSAQGYAPVDERAEKRSSYGTKSSDEQSFKSCTDLPDFTEHQLDDTDPAQKSFYDFVAPEVPFKESDARSFKTCKDSLTPDRVTSLPASRLSSNLNSPNLVEAKSRRPASEMPISSARISDQELPLPSKSESNVSKAGTNCSTAPERNVLQPPTVPPRHSSTGREAQRSVAVLNNVITAFCRSVGMAPRSQASASDVRKEAVVGEHQPDNDQTVPAPSQIHQRSFSSNSNATVGSPDVILGSSIISNEIGSVANSGANTRKAIHQRGSHTPPAIVRQRSFVMTSNDIPPERRRSSSHRGHPSSTGNPQTPVPSRRNSQTTVHPSQHGRNHMNPPVNRSSAPPQRASLPHPSGDISLSRPQSSSARNSQTPGLSRHNSQTTTHLELPRRNTVNPPPLNAYSGQLAPFHNQDTTTFLRPSSHNNQDLGNMRRESSEYRRRQIKNKASPHTPLYDVQEEPHEDNEDVVGGRTSAQSYSGRCLGPHHRLPSLNFSQTNLMSESDFKPRSSRVSQSLDLSKSRVQTRRESTVSEPSRGAREDKHDSVSGSLDADEPTKRENADRLSIKRPFSPKLVAELEELKIPNVADGLTERFNQYLPTLRIDGSGNGAEAEQALVNTLDEIHGIGGPTNKKSNARLRPIPGSPEMQVVEDDVYDKLNNSDCNVNADVRGSVMKQELGDMEAGVIQGARARDNGTTTTTEGPQTQAPSDLPTRPRSLSDPTVHTSSESQIITGRPYDFLALSLPRTPHGPSRLRSPVSDASSASSTLSAYDSASHSYSSRPRSCKPPKVSFDTNGVGLTSRNFRLIDQSHPAGERYPTSCGLPLPESHHDPNSSSLSIETSGDDEPEPSSSRRLKFNRRSRPSARAPVALSTASRAQEVSSEESTELPRRQNRNTFTGVSGMSKLGYWTTSTIVKIKSWGKKAARKVRKIVRRNRQAEAAGTTGPSTANNQQLSESDTSSTPASDIHARPNTGHDSGYNDSREFA